MVRSRIFHNTYKERDIAFYKGFVTDGDVIPHLEVYFYSLVAPRSSPIKGDFFWRIFKQALGTYGMLVEEKEGSHANGTTG